VITACKSAGLNESTNCLVVGLLAGEGDGAAGEPDAIGGGLTGCVGAGDVGVGDWARRFAPKIEIARVASKNRDITVIFRRYP
jgi:hypothetical protein